MGESSIGEARHVCWSHYQIPEADPVGENDPLHQTGPARWPGADWNITPGLPNPITNRRFMVHPQPHHGYRPPRSQQPLWCHDIKIHAIGLHNKAAIVVLVLVANWGPGGGAGAGSVTFENRLPYQLAGKYLP